MKVYEAATRPMLYRAERPMLSFFVTVFAAVGAGLVIVLALKYLFDLPFRPLVIQVLAQMTIVPALFIWGYERWAAQEYAKRKDEIDFVATGRALDPLQDIYVEIARGASVAKGHSQ